MRDNPLWGLILIFLPLSLLSVGGGPSILAGMQNQVVEARHWMSEREFIDLFAISRAAPGPGVLMATLVGWKIAGLAGAIVASLALFLPSSLLYYAVARQWNAHRGRRWHTALERGLAPIAAGLILAIAAVSTAILLWRPKLNPLWLLAAGGVAAVLIG
jgi:chromate transporter